MRLSPATVSTEHLSRSEHSRAGRRLGAAAILDRVMHKAIVFKMRGPPWRLREHNGLEIATTNLDR